MKIFSVIAICLIALGGCGGSSGEGLLALKVIDARQPAGLQAGSSLPPLLVVERFKIRITGEGIDPAIEQESDGKAHSIEINEIPAGHDRTILIEAYNFRGQVIRRREITGVVIEPGIISPLEARLNTVPIFSNIAEGNVIASNRLLLRGYGEPASQLEIFAEQRELISSDTSEALISPSLNLGEFSFKPGELPVGVHTFTVKDRETGESSQVTVVLVPAGQRPGRTIAAAAGNFSVLIEPRGSFLRIVEHRRNLRTHSKDQGGIP